MMYSKKLHFMHIPKTAGTSLATMLDQQFKFQDICPAYFVYHLPPWAEQHLKLSSFSCEQIQQYGVFMHHLGWIPRLFFSSDAIETITFLRDPIERMLSEFNHITRDTSSYPRLANRWNSFEDFLWDPICDEFFKADIQTRSFCADLYFKADFSSEIIHDITTEFIHHPFGHRIQIPAQQLLQLAIERMHSCAFVGITEKYDESIDIMAEQFPWLALGKKQTLNVAPRRTMRSQLSTKTLDRAMELNQLDIQLYQEALKLLEDRNRTRIAVHQPAPECSMGERDKPTTEIQFNFEDKFFGQNWHVREHSQSYVFCWSNNKTATLLFSILPQQDLYLSFHVLYFLIPEDKDNLTLTVNNHPIPLFHYPHPNVGFVFESIIPMHALQQNCSLELVFSLPTLKRPIDINPDSSDTRELGLACSAVTIKALSVDHLEENTKLKTLLFEKENQILDTSMNIEKQYNLLLDSCSGHPLFTLQKIKHRFV